MRTHSAPAAAALTFLSIFLAVSSFVRAPAASQVSASPKAGEAEARTESLAGARTESLARSGKAVVGEKAPWLSGWTLKNEVFNIRKPFDDPAVKRLSIVFFATWCKPCREGFEKKLVPAASRLEKAGVFVVVVDVAEKEEKVRTWVRKRKLPFPVVLDPYGNSRKTYLRNGEQAESKIPLTVLIGRDGNIEAIFRAEGRDYIERIIAGK